MDDFPAGPASPGPRRPSLSVVIPVHNGGRDFERCLRRLRDSRWTDFELIVVDDGSTDGSAALAESCGARVRPARVAAGPGGRPERRGTGRLGAADLLPRRRRRRPSRDAGPGRRAVRGRSRPGRALRLVRRRARRARPGQPVPQPAPPLRPPAGRVRRRRPAGPDVLDRLRRDPAAGLPRPRRLRPRLYRRPAIEDIELGYRLTRAGHRIVLARDVQATHLKRWTLRERGPHRHLPARRALDAPDASGRGSPRPT